MKKLLQKIELLELLVKGCRVHPAYRAIRPATGKCLPCVEMWQARQELNDLENAENSNPQPDRLYLTDVKAYGRFRYDVRFSRW